MFDNELIENKSFSFRTIVDNDLTIDMFDIWTDIGREKKASLKVKYVQTLRRFFLLLSKKVSVLFDMNVDEQNDIEK